MHKFIQFYHSLGLLTSLVLLVSSLLLSTLLGCVLLWASRIKPLQPPQGGNRGAQRKKAFESSFFARTEPALRYLGAVVDLALRWSRLRGGRFRMWADALVRFQRRQLIWAGEPLGLEAREVIGLSLLLSCCGAALGIYLGLEAGTLKWAGPLGLLLLSMPTIRLQSLVAERFAEMSRELPASIDLMAMAMNAGSDFPGAIRQVIEGQKGVVSGELGQVLLSLDLGITRARALAALRERAPTSDVRDLVRAVLMAEKKGSSLTDALMQQAQTSRQRRSERAEEAAARAGVLLLFPLMLLMGCIMILLVGPLLSSGLGI